MDATSAEGQIDLLLAGDDGLWLFAAPDRTVIPEPTGVTIAVLVFATVVPGARRRRYGKSVAA